MNNACKHSITHISDYTGTHVRIHTVTSDAHLGDPGSDVGRTLVEAVVPLEVPAAFCGHAAARTVVVVEAVEGRRVQLPAHVRCAARALLPRRALREGARGGDVSTRAPSTESTVRGGTGRGRQRGTQEGCPSPTRKMVLLHGREWSK